MTDSDWVGGIATTPLRTLKKNFPLWNHRVLSPEWHSDLQRGEILVHITIDELVTMFDVFKARVEIPVPPAAHFLGFVELKQNESYSIDKLPHD